MSRLGFEKQWSKSDTKLVSGDIDEVSTGAVRHAGCRKPLITSSSKASQIADCLRARQYKLRIISLQLG